MLFDVKVTPLAKVDIDRNAQWWADNHSVEKAVHWADTVEQQMQALQSMPARFGVAQENDRFPIEIRSMPVGLGTHPTYRAVYTVVESTVHILAVRRGSERPLEPVDFPNLPT